MLLNAQPNSQSLRQVRGLWIGWVRGDHFLSVDLGLVGGIFAESARLYL